MHMKRRYKVLIIVLAFLVMTALATGYLTNEMQWVGLRQTGNHTDEGATLITDTYQVVNKYPNYAVWEVSYDSDETYVYAMDK